jgi:hypothetical protein
MDPQIETYDPYDCFIHVPLEFDGQRITDDDFRTAGSQIVNCDPLAVECKRHMDNMVGHLRHAIRKSVNDAILFDLSRPSTNE